MMEGVKLSLAIRVGRKVLISKKNLFFLIYFKGE